MLPPNEPAATSDPHFDLDRVRLEAARALPAECFDDFQRLAKTLIHGPPFQWLLVEAPDQRLRSRVLDALDTALLVAHLNASRLVVDPSVADVVELEQKLVSHAQQSPVVQVLVASDWFDEAGRRWDALNARRERIAHAAKARLVFWLNKEGIERAARYAPDLWAWRGGIYTFKVDVRPMPGAALERWAPRPTGLDTRSMAERHRRIAEIRAWLANNPAPPDDLLAPILDELGKLLYSVGDYDAALAHWRDQGLPLYVRLRDERARVITLGNIADILQERGELDEALRIYREEQLPVLERLGDVRSLLVTRANLASTLLARAAVGDREEADQLLRLALTEAERLHLPEAEWIRAVRKRAGLLDE